MGVPAWVEQAKELRGEGASWADLSRQLSVSVATIKYHCDPLVRESRIAYQRQYRQTSYGRAKRREQSHKWRSRPENKRRLKLYHRKHYTRIENRAEQSVKSSRVYAAREGHKPCVTESGTIAAAYTGKCDICGAEDGAPGDRKHRLNVDHCHATGVFRGWLCSRCNNVLGRVKDDTTLLAGVLAYLQKERQND